MAITAQMVKELRDMTGCGMLDSKKALEATNGNIDEAIEFLRKKGLAGAEKKAGRITAEGVSFTKLSSDFKTGVVVEVNSETDFVAKNEKFRDYVNKVAEQALKTSAKDLDSFLNEKWKFDNSKTVKEELSSQISIIGENLTIRRFDKISAPNGLVYDYMHMGGKIGVLVAIESNVINDDIKEGTAEFGIIMMDLNNLKYVNDNYGHERGNDYIFGSCRLLCEIFAHSAVYRVGRYYYVQ